MKYYFKHPKSVCMTYLTHMYLSLYFSYILFIGSIQAFFHAFYPDIFITSTSDLNQKVYKLLTNSGCR